MDVLRTGDRIAVLTSGGDAPGMNAAVRAVVGVGSALGLEVYGVRWGYQGLLEGDLVRLDPRVVDDWNRRGGSELGSSRCPAFREASGRAQALEQLKSRGIRGLCVIGGDGSLSGAHVLADDQAAGGGDDPSRIAVVAIPASIDNDIGRTSLAIGVDTALNTIVEACDRIADTASSHARTFVIEVMGRECGYLAMTAAVAAGADGVLFREADLGEDELIDQLEAMVLRAHEKAAPSSVLGDRKRRVLVLKSEGVRVPVEWLKERLDQRLAAAGRPVDTRVTVLGHTVRGGSPSAQDRVIAARLGHAAVRALQRGLTDVMCGWHVRLGPGETAKVFDLDPYVTFWPLAQVLAETRDICEGVSEISRWRVRLLHEIAPYLNG